MLVLVMKLVTLVVLLHLLMNQSTTSLEYNGELGAGELGAALGTSGGQIENQTEELMYEVYYSYPVNDGMTITPLVYVKEQSATTTPDQTGVMVKTSFSF